MPQGAVSRMQYNAAGVGWVFRPAQIILSSGRKTQRTLPRRQFMPPIPAEFMAGLKRIKELDRRYLATGDVTALNESVENWDTIREHPYFLLSEAWFRAAVLNDCGATLIRRYQATGERADLDQASALWRESLDLTPEDSDELPGRLINLGNALRYRYLRTGDAFSLQHGISAWERAVEITPPGSPYLAGRLSNLGLGLNDRYQRNGSLDDLSRAIATLDQSIAITPQGSPDSAGRLNNLGMALSDRFDRLGDAADLERAIEVWEQAAKAASPDAPIAAAIFNNLGNGMHTRFLRTGKTQNLDRAIQLWQRSVDATHNGSPELPVRLNNLGTGLKARYSQNGDFLDGQATPHQARMAFLSACQTATTDFESLPDESIGLPAGFLQAGISVVLGTLWPVDDLSTALFASWFYRFLVSDNLPPGAALQRTQQWMKSITVGELLREVKATTSHGPDSRLKQAAIMRFGLEDEDVRPFTAWHWSPFILVGHA